MSSDGYYRHPTIFGSEIVFVSEDDLWTVDVQGGFARRLTSNPGMITFPSFSPDGRLLAFTSRDEGPPEAYVMASEGGPPSRITHMGSFTYVAGWTPDGRVVVATDWKRPFRADFTLWAVAVDGGPPTQLVAGPARAITFEREGPGVAMARGLADPARWKRYRGGTAGTIWVDRHGDGEFSKLIALDGNLAAPMWLGRRIYFLSDHEGTGNLYSTTPGGRSLQRHTNHEDFYARFPATDGRRIVYHAGADLWIYDAEAADARPVSIQTSGSRSQRNRRFVSASDHLESYSLHPNGHSVALVARGGAFTMPLWEGAPLRHGVPSEARRRLATWLPDGKRLIAISDETGEESLVVANADGSGRARLITGDLGRAATLAAAPAGSMVALSNQRHELIVVDVSSGESQVVHHSPWEPIAGHAWSPDGRWLAYAAFESHTSSAVHLCDTKTWEKTRVTRPDFIDVAPSFDPEGRYLYFLSWRVFDPVVDGHFFERGFPRGARPYLVTLRAELSSPFAAATREPRPPGSPEEPEANKADNSEPPETDIDLDGIESRIVEFPVPEARYRAVRGAEGRVLLHSVPVAGSLQPPADKSKPKGVLEAYEFASEKTERVAEGISSFEVSSDGKVMAIRAGKKLRVVPASFKESEEKKTEEPGRESGYVDLGRLKVEVVPGSEWQQMFSEAWRLQRDQFWTETMSDVDWEGVYDRYLPLVDRVGSRAEFSDLMWEMQGELGTSHAYELGGDYRPEPKWFQGFLGADLVWDDGARSWRVDRVPTGDPWDITASSPLTRPGANVSEGDLIVAVDGVETSKRRSPDRLFVHKADSAVTLAVRTPGARRRTLLTQALRSELPLRYRDWVEKNRRTTHERTDGEVGYVHIPDMGPRGFAEFHRYFRAEVDRPGLIIDVRQNSGGNVSQLLLERLARRRVGYDVSRWSEPQPWPVEAPTGPMVCLTDEYSGSDGDIFSHAFKLMDLGPLIGKRTWGGVVGIFPRHALVDGTITTQPEFAFWFKDVGWGVENYGTDPDIEVEIRPQDHAADADPQLDKAIAEALKEIRRARPKVPEFQPIPSRQPPRLEFD
ncbi:MAG: S41 family peptidase [Acidimicrobiia bacterium]